MTSQNRSPLEDTAEVLELFEKIAALGHGAIAFHGTIIRSVGYKYATVGNFFSGTGAAKAGGRWNRVGIEAVYASLDVHTATSEAYQNIIDFGFPLSSIKPRVTAGASVLLSKVLDLSDASNRRKIGFGLQQLLDEDWRGIQAAGEESWTQAIGRGCYLAGFEALIVPSARNRSGRNIVLYLNNLLKTSQLKLLAVNDFKNPD